MASNIHNKRFPQTSTFMWLVGIIVLGIIIASVVRSTLDEYTVRNSFCTPDDEIYQTIHANLDTWVKNYFPPNKTSSRNYLYFTTPNGERYTAIGMEPDRFFVFTESDYPHTYMEAKGYIYLPSEPGQNWSEYRYTALGDSIYCYESKL